MKSNVVRAFVLLALATATCYATLEFSAYTQTAQESKFIVTDMEAAQTSGWLAIGQTFKGYVLVSFDRKNEVLSVRKGETTINLPLKVARVKEGDAKAAEIARQLAVAKEELTELRKKFLDEHPIVKVQLKKIADLERKLAK